jgi:hypothetical protein
MIPIIFTPTLIIVDLINPFHTSAPRGDIPAQHFFINTFSLLQLLFAASSLCCLAKPSILALPSRSHLHVAYWCRTGQRDNIL